MMTINKYLFCLALAAGSAMAQEGTTPLMECAWNGSAADVCALFAAGADVNARDHVGRTVLDYARTAGVVAYLRAQGARSGRE